MRKLQDIGIWAIVAIQGLPWAQTNGREHPANRFIIPSQSPFPRISLNIIA